MGLNHKAERIGRDLPSEYAFLLLSVKKIETGYCLFHVHKEGDRKGYRSQLSRDKNIFPTDIIN